MSLFVLICLSGLPNLLVRWKQHAERKFGVKGYTYRSLRFLKAAVDVLMFACVTMLTIPTYKVCAHIVDCVPREGRRTVAIAPELACYTGSHLMLVIVAVPVVLIYSLLLMPHFVVNGDTNYVDYGSLHLINPRNWQFRTERFATTIYTDFIHPCKQFAFRNAVADLAVKITMPCAEILLTRWPLTKMLLLTVIVIIHFTFSILFRPYVNWTTSAFVRLGRGITVLGMMCGMLTVIGKDARQVAHVVFFSMLCLVVPAIVIVIVWNRKELCQRVRNKDVAMQLARCECPSCAGSVRESTTSSNSLKALRKFRTFHNDSQQCPVPEVSEQRSRKKRNTWTPFCTVGNSADVTSSRRCEFPAAEEAWADRGIPGSDPLHPVTLSDDPVTLSDVTET
jgi:hypothetical protein